MERMWFYAQGNERKGPIAESELKALIQKNEVSGNDLAWTEGMSNWAPIYSLPDLNAGGAAAAASIIQRANPSMVTHPAHSPHTAAGEESVPDGLVGWLGFVGVVTIVSGVFNVLSCFGVIFGVFQIISGVALMGAKTALDNIDSVPASLGPFFQKMKTFAQMTGIFYIAMIVTLILVMALYATIFAAVLSQAMSGLQ